MPPVVQLVCALVGVIALIFLFFWVLRKVNKGILTTGGKRLKVLDRASLGGEKSVVVVSVAGKCMVLGVTAGRISAAATNIPGSWRSIYPSFTLMDRKSRIASLPLSVTHLQKT